MSFTALDDAPPSGFSPVEDDSKGFTPVEDGPAPEGVFQSFLHPIERYLPSSLITAGAGLGAGALASETGPGAVVADIAAGTAAGAGYEKARELAMKPGDIEAEQAQLAANEKANPWSSKIGTMIGQLPAFLGGGTGLFKGAKAAAEAAGTKFVPTALQEAAHMAAGGARSSGSEAAAANVDGQDVSIPEAIAKGAITMGPLGFVSKIPGLADAATSYVGKTLQTLGHAAGSAEILAHSNALYNSVVNGTPYDEAEVQKTALSDAPAFALLGAAGHLAAGKPAHELDAPIANAAAAGQTETAAALEKLKGQVEQKTGAAAEPFPVPETEENNETTENRPVETNNTGDIGPSLLGTEGGGEVPPVGESNAEASISDPFTNQPVEDNAPPTQPEQAGVPVEPESGDESGKTTEAGSSDSLLSPEEVPSSQGTNAQNGGDVENPSNPKEFGIKNAVVDEYLKARGLPPVPEGTGADVVKRIMDTRQAYVDNPQRAFELVKKFQENPGVRPTVEEQGILDNHFVSLDRQTKLVEIEAQNPNLSEEDRQKAANRAEVLDEHVGELAEVARKLGTHWSDEGRARQVTLDQDYGVMRQLIRKTRLKGGNLTPEEIKQTRQESQAYEAQAKVVREMEKANDEADKAKGAEGVIEGVKKTPKTKKVTAEESQKSVEQKIKDALANKAALKGKSDEVQSSTPIPGEPPQEVTTGHQKQALSILRKSAAGRMLLRGAVIVPDWERAISHPELRSFSSDEINRIKKSEGFFDPQTGKAVVIRENIQPQEGETGEEAFMRVLRHERVGHEAVKWMRANDPEFEGKWRKAVALISKEELDGIAGPYAHLKGDPDQLVGEWFARKVQSLKEGELPDPKTAFGKMWQAIKDFLERTFGKSDRLDQHVRDLARQIYNSSEAFEGKSGYEGELETQHALKPEEKNSLSDLPHSVLADLARHVVEFGHKAGEKMTEPELTKGMHDILNKSVPDVTESEVRRSHSEYGKIIKPSKDEVSKTLADLKGQQRLISGLEDVKQGFMAKLKGLLARKTSPEYRALEKELNDEIVARKLRKQNETQRSSPLDKKISTLSNAIADTEKEIADLRAGGSIKYRNRSKVVNDAEADKLEAKLKTVRAERDQVIKERGGDPVEIAKKIKATEDRIKELQGKIDRNELDVEEKEKSPSSPELDAARKILKEKNDELSAKRSARDKPVRDAEKAQNDLDDAQARAIQLEAKLDSGDLSKNPIKRKEVSAELQSVRDQIKGLNKGIADARLAAEKPAREAKAAAKELADAKERVVEMEAKLAKGDLSTKERPKRDVSAELAAEREKLKELNKEMAGKRANLESHTPPSEQEYREALAETKKRNADKIAENQKRIDTNDFTPRLKKKPFSDDEIELQKMKLLKQRAQILKGNEKLRLASRTKVQKFFDGAVKLKRFMVLSSATVYGKLAAAAAVKTGLTGLEDLQGGVLRKILPKSVSSAAKIESGSSLKALGQAFSKAFSKGMKDASDTLKTGQSELDLKYGKPKALDEGWTSFLGRLHGFIKAPVKRMAFEYAQAKQYENYAKEGVDLSSEPLLMAKAALKSYEYANRAIFMNDNALTKNYNLFLNGLQKSGGGWAGLARTLRILLPIIKVPSNIALEAGTYAGGVPVGLFKLAKAWHAGLDKISDEESEAIHRALKKGLLGSALMLMGFFNPNMFGGYYQKGIKRRDNEAEYGGVQIGGENIPKWLLHSPAFEVLQMGATARRVADSRFHGQERGLSSGALAGALGLASEIPFVNEMIKTGDLQSPEGRSKYFGELAKAQIIPAALDQLARHQDKTAGGTPIKREPRNFSEVLKTGVPVLREQVPAKKPAKPQ